MSYFCQPIEAAAHTLLTNENARILKHLIYETSLLIFHGYINLKTDRGVNSDPISVIYLSDKLSFFLIFICYAYACICFSRIKCHNLFVAIKRQVRSDIEMKETFTL